MCIGPSRSPETVNPGQGGPEVGVGPLGVSVRGALPCSQVVRRRRTGDRRRADGAASSRPRFVADAVTPRGSGTDDPPGAGRLRAVSDRSLTSPRRHPRVVALPRRCGHPFSGRPDIHSLSPAGATSPKGVLRRLLEPPKGLVHRGSGPSDGPPPGPRDLRRGHLTCGFSLPGGILRLRFSICRSRCESSNPPGGWPQGLREAFFVHRSVHTLVHRLVGVASAVDTGLWTKVVDDGWVVHPSGSGAPCTLGTGEGPSE